MRQWALQDEHEDIVLQRIEELALPEFQRRLTEDNPANPARLQMLILAPHWHPENLPLAWREPIVEAAKQSVKALFDKDGFAQQRGKTVLVGGGEISKVLAWLPDYIEAPAWLEPTAIRWLESQSIHQELGLTFKVLSATN